MNKNFKNRFIFSSHYFSCNGSKQPHIFFADQQHISEQLSALLPACSIALLPLALALANPTYLIRRLIPLDSRRIGSARACCLEP
ncbi:MAG: hypothetical protein ACNA74_07585 [Desulfurivibrio sp.]